MLLCVENILLFFVRQKLFIHVQSIFFFLCIKHCLILPNCHFVNRDYDYVMNKIKYHYFNMCKLVTSNSVCSSINLKFMNKNY